MTLSSIIWSILGSRLQSTAVRPVRTFSGRSPSSPSLRTDCIHVVQSSPRVRTDGLDYGEHCFCVCPPCPSRDNLSSGRFDRESLALYLISRLDSRVPRVSFRLFADSQLMTAKCCLTLQQYLRFPGTSQYLAQGFPGAAESIDPSQILDGDPNSACGPKTCDALLVPPCAVHIGIST